MGGREYGVGAWAYAPVAVHQTSNVDLSHVCLVAEFAHISKLVHGWSPLVQPMRHPPPAPQREQSLCRSAKHVVRREGERIQERVRRRA